MAELQTLNQRVVGSTPTRPIQKAPEKSGAFVFSAPPCILSPRFTEPTRLQVLHPSPGVFSGAELLHNSVPGEDASSSLRDVHELGDLARERLTH